MLRRSLVLLSTMSLIAVLLAGGNAAAGPVLGCGTPPAPTTPDGRVFPEPQVSLTFVTFDEFECGVGKLDEAYPDLMEITEIGRSFDDLPIYDVLLTDETVSRPKRKLLVVNSIHGNEAGGREGAFRVLEDMVDPDLLGDEPWVQEVLDEFVIHFVFPNPDGWASGDAPGGTMTRGNGNGRDLNRQFPVQGYIYTPNATLAEPEGNAVIDEMFTGEDARGWYLGTDNHGQGNDEYAAAGLQIVGQFHYQKSETLARFADAINAAMAEYGVLEDLEALREATGQDLGPYHWGTLYDMLGYSASGSMIDWYNTVTGVNGTGFATELTMGQSQTYAVYPNELAQVWVDSIRAINYTMFKQAIDPIDYTYHVGGKAAYVFDHRVIRHDDANGAGYVRQEGEDIPQRPYRATRMKFFTDLNRYADEPLTTVYTRAIAQRQTDLSQFDSLILANNAMPVKGSRQRYYARIKEWVEAGGNLIVTDAAAPALVRMGLVPPEAITMAKHYVGYVDFVDRDHPLAANLRGVARQTYDSVPIGYGFPPPASHCPVWRVDRATWEAAGGVTVGTNQSQTAFGEIPLGDGVVRFIGALLPQPTEDFYHPYGLQNYAVTYTGYTILQNSLDWTNPNRAA